MGTGVEVGDIVAVGAGSRVWVGMITVAVAAGTGGFDGEQAERQNAPSRTRLKTE
jgi:hypothetical protein